MFHSKRIGSNSCKCNFTAAAFGIESLQDTGGTVTLGTNGTFNITVPEGHYVEMTITFSSNRGFDGCYFGKYFEIRDGLNQSATLLAAFCEFYKDKTYGFWSSGRHMWLRLHRADFFPDLFKYHANYTAKTMNVTGMYSVTLDHFVCSTNLHVKRYLVKTDNTKLVSLLQQLMNLFSEYIFSNFILYFQLHQSFAK